MFFFNNRISGSGCGHLKRFRSPKINVLAYPPVTSRHEMFGIFKIQTSDITEDEHLFTFSCPFARVRISLCLAFFFMFSISLCSPLIRNQFSLKTTTTSVLWGIYGTWLLIWVYHFSFLFFFIVELTNYSSEPNKASSQ